MLTLMHTIVIEHYLRIIGEFYNVCGNFTWRVSDWWRHLRKHLGINETNYFMYQWAGPVSSPHPSELLHLNQACVQNFIGNLTAWCPYDNLKFKDQN